MIDVLDGIELMGAVASRPDPGQAVADFRTLYAIYQDAQSRGGKISIGAMIKAGTLKAEVDALARTAALASDLLADKTNGPRLTAFLASIFGE